MDARDIIKKPVLTESSYDDIANKKYTFLVDVRANKYQIRKAVEEVFGVKVKSVNTLRQQGKLKRQGRYVGRTPRTRSFRDADQVTQDHRVLRFAGAVREDTPWRSRNINRHHRRRGMTVSTFEEITCTVRKKSLLEPIKKTAGRNVKASPCHRGGGVKRNTASSISSATRTVCRQSQDDRVRPEPHGAHRAAALCGRREALHLSAGGLEGGRHRDVGRRRGHQAGQCALY